MSEKISLLVVEDEALIAENLRLALEDLGYHVAATCYTYEEARRAFDTQPTDLVLLDLNLNSPTSYDDGLALAAELRILGRPFIFLTAYNDLDTIRRATRLQPAGYLIKPANNATLFAAIQTAIEGSQNAQAALAPSENPAPLPDFFFVKIGDHKHKLYWADVAVLEAGKNYVTLRAADLQRSYPIRGSLAYVLDNLVPEALRPRFLRISRRLSLNLAFITSYDDTWIYCGPERFENSPVAIRRLEELGY